MDLISNGDNQEDLDEEDCDDLKSCIPLGDETVDQLIKDNLQVDNLDLITPKMEHFNFSLENLHTKNKLTLNDLFLPLKSYGKKCIDSFKDFSLNTLPCKSKGHLPHKYKQHNPKVILSKQITATEKQSNTNKLKVTEKLSNSKIIRDSSNASKSSSICSLVLPHKLTSKPMSDNLVDVNVTLDVTEYDSSQNVTLEQKSESVSSEHISHQAEVDLNKQAAKLQSSNKVDIISFQINSHNSQSVPISCEISGISPITDSIKQLPNELQKIGRAHV